MTVSAPSLPPGFVTAPGAIPGADHQASFDDLGTPLAQTTFVVLDLETTGASAQACEITEIGALKLRGGECLGHFETLVNPGVPIPPMITVLTGITEAMVLPAPTIDEVLPSLLEFIGGAVIVGHNVRFDVGFLDAALLRSGRSRLTNRRVDTLAMARRLVRDEVPNLKLGTLAAHLRVPTEPSHRAMADTRATAEVFHVLLERAAGLGVLGLDDLLALPTARAHPSSSKLAMTANLPREPGVYVFRDRAGRPLYVGKATNLRARVRSYFADDRRKVPQMLREAQRVDHLVCGSPLEAAVREARLIRAWQPRFNRQMKAWSRYAYVALTDERFPRLTVTKTVRNPDAVVLGPLHSSSAAHFVREAIESALPIRRCNRRIGRRSACDAPLCAAAQLGVATCPCSGAIAEEAYAGLAEQVRRGLTIEPRLLFDPLEDRMHRLADQQRFEEAAATRDRLDALARAIHRTRTLAQLRRPARLVADLPDGRIELRHGKLLIETGPGASELDNDDGTGPARREDLDELLVVARHLARNAARVGLVAVDGVFASARGAVGRYEPARR